MNAPKLFTKLGLALATASVLAAGSAMAQQASLNLQGSTMSYCHTVNNTWEVTKSVDQTTVNTGSSVTWTIQATKNDGGPAPDSTFCVDGTLVINNAGAAPATVGNIVVNAQKQFTIAGKKRWVAASVDIADKTNRDLATKANVVAAATAEDAGWNAAVNTPATYTVSGAVGTFKENAASGSIEFADGAWNDVLANNAYVIAPGATVVLNYKATFNGVLLNLDPAGDHVRTEVLVTFGNAGARGGSGASITNVDIDGDGSVTGGESNVRTVPVRASLDVPPLEQCNPSVTLTDTFSSDGVSYEVTGGTMPSSLTASVNTSTTYTLITTLTGSGTITNTVDLAGTETDCCDAASDSASATVTVTDVCLPNDPRPECNQLQCPCGESETSPGRCNICSGGGYCSLTQGAYNIKAKGIGNVVFANFPTVFPAGIKVGDQSDALQGNAPYTAYWTNTTVGRSALRQFIGGGTGSPSALSADLTNPNTMAGRQVASQTLALSLNVGFSAAGVMTNGTLTGATNFGDVIVCPVDGAPCPVPTLTVNQILGIANTILSGGTVSGWTLGSIGGVVANLNQGFDECTVNGWAQTHTASP
jgi:hypothetical protein